MKRTTRVLLVIGFVALVAIAWMVVLGADSDSDKQKVLLEQAGWYLEDEVYILSVPILEEAAGYDAQYTEEAETLLKGVYLTLSNQRGYKGKYIELLEKQMNREDAPPEVFREAAEFYMEDRKYAEAFDVLKNGIAKTGDSELVSLYEANRYGYKLGRTVYEDVTAIYGSTIGVSTDGLWGLASANGIPIIPCIYEKISTFSAGRVIVQKDGVISAVDSNSNRLAVLKLNDGEGVSDFYNLANDRIPLCINGQWYRATGTFGRGSAAFEQIGMYSGGYVAAKQDGKWGIVDTGTTWLIPAEYDEIIMDELGRSYMQKAAFARRGTSVFLFIDGVQVGEAYEDARPFGEEGYAAVKKGGKWGFIDNSGELKIDYTFEDALSFGQHLAAVKVDGMWGYISLRGEVVIEPVFLQAKSFASGSAPVLTERGWQFITLVEK